jgi:hypothetical protein
MDDEAYRISKMYFTINRLQAEQRCNSSRRDLSLQKQSDVSQNSKKPDVEKPSDGMAQSLQMPLFY